MSHNNILDPQEENQQLLSRLWDGVKRKGEGKCYCPFSQCMRFNRRRLKISTTKIHCREHGHIEGEHEYRQLVSFSLYMFLY